MTLLLPSSEISNVGWAAVGRATTFDCLTSFDEDGTYAQAAAQGNVLVVGLAVGTSPAAGTLHTVSVRARQTGLGVAPAKVFVELLETATVRGSATFTTVWPGPFVWQTFTFTSSTVAVHSDLRLRFTASQLGSQQRLRVTAAKLEYLDILALPRAARGSSAYAGVQAGSGVYAGVGSRSGAYAGVETGSGAYAGVQRGAAGHCI